MFKHTYTTFRYKYGEERDKVEDKIVQEKIPLHENLLKN